MRGRRQDETFQQYVIAILWETGRLFTVPQASLGVLSLRDKVVIDALIDLQKFHAAEVAQRTLEHHNRLPNFDGELGPAMTDFFEKDIQKRCPIPDYAPPKGVVFQFEDHALQEVVLAMQRAEPALGIGNWKSCHGIGDAHCATVLVDPTYMPVHVKRNWLEIIRLVQKSYADVGLLFRYLDQSRKDYLTGEKIDSNINIDMSWVTRSDGWIGLAIVGTNQDCGDRIWAQFLATYVGGSTDQQIVQQQVSLIKHELGHNCGFGHASSGVMSPTLVNGLPHEWAANDPTTPKLKKQFSGVPVAIPGGGTPKPPSPPVGDVQSQIDDLNLRQSLMQIQLNWLIKNRKSPHE